MRILQIYNQYRSAFAGEETVVHQTANLVKNAGGEARLLMKSSRGLDSSINRKLLIFFSGIYNPFAARELMEVLASYRPDVAHVHNLYPLFSPSVLVTLRKAAIPVVMTVHNHFHTCPTADHYYNGRTCERCVGGREYFCVVRNCRNSMVESIAYATRSAIARKLRLFIKNVSIVIALNEFARRRLVGAGFDPDRVVVLPNMVDIPQSPTDASLGRYAMFSGRMCSEKGVSTLLEAAERVLDIPVRLFGDGPTLEKHENSAPRNATFLGRAPMERIHVAYRSARFLVVPSRWFEGCPLVILEAMSHGLPVVASRIGGLPEIVDDGVTGLLFEPGNIEELADRMRRLWVDPGLCRKMGEAGRRRAIREHSESKHWKRLNEIYHAAMGVNL